MRLAGSRLVASVLMAVLTACSSGQVLAPSAGPALRDTGEGDGPTAPHLVLFRRSALPPGFVEGVEALGGRVLRVWPQVGLAGIAGLSSDALGHLAASESVLAIEPDIPLRLEEPQPVALRAVLTLGPSATRVGGAQDPTTALLYGLQWNMRLIRADAAWAAGALGRPEVTLAVLDTGIDDQVPDLAGRVDLTRSVSFVESDDVLVDALFPGRHPVTDLHYHGTHVAATAVSNAVVLAGVTSRVTLVGVKVCDRRGTCPLLSVLAGIVHAAEAGAQVANLSLGGSFDKAALPGLHSAITRVLNYARRRGMLLVVAAGNAGRDLDHDGSAFSAYCDGPAVLCVSAVGPVAAAGPFGPWQDPDAFAAYSNFGRSAIALAGPGGNHGGSVWSACAQTSLVIPVCGTGLFVLALQGTSMATPHVAAVAALLAQEGERPERVRARLLQTADDILDPGNDPWSGAGRVNAARATGARLGRRCRRGRGAGKVGGGSGRCT